MNLRMFLALISITVLSCCTGKKEEKAFIWPLGVCTSIDNGVLLDSIGFSYVEENLQRFLVPTEPHEAFLARLEMLKRSPIPARAVNVFLPGSLKSVGPQAMHDDIIAYADTAFRRARVAGIETIVFGSGASRSIPEGFGREEAIQQFVILLKRLGPVAAKYDVFVVIEPLNREEVNFINSVAEGLELVKAADHPNIRLLCDFYHMLKEQEPADHIIQSAGYLRHVHVAELAGRTPPGVAGDDFRPYLRALKAIGYEGLISVEARWTSLEDEAPVAYEALLKQIEEVVAEKE